jgi:uncharacterized repeat protein (TIGR01451 family)
MALLRLPGSTASNDCAEDVLSTTNVVLTAAAETNSQFESWINCDSPSGSQCTMTMNADKTVTATFNLIPPNITATKEASNSVTGSLTDFKAGDTIKYTVVLTNTGGATLNDEAGPEFTDTITDLLLRPVRSATSTLGTISYDRRTRTYSWNGSIPAGASVTLTFSVRTPTRLEGTRRFCNQGTAKDGAGGTVLTSDPTPLPGLTDPELTCVDVVGRPEIGFPLTLQGIEALLVRDMLHFTALGTGIKAISAQVFALTGQRVYASNWVANGHEWSLQNTNGKRVANGIYLYVMSVRGYDEKSVKIQVKKLIIRR